MKGRKDSTLSGKPVDSGPVPLLSLTAAKADPRFSASSTTSFGGDHVVIANCPSCGTHFKHEAPVLAARARCGRCDSTLPLTRLARYRIVMTERPPLSRGQLRRPIGLVDPSLAATITRNVAQPTSAPAATAQLWDVEEPLPPIPEMQHADAFAAPMPHEGDGDMLSGAEAPDVAGAWNRDSGGATTFALWVATGAIAGTGASWTVGGTTFAGLAAGAALGVLAGWGWMRWTSPK